MASRALYFDLTPPGLVSRYVTENGLVEPDPVAIGGSQLFHVFTRAAADYTPLRPVLHVQQTVIGEKAHKQAGRKSQHPPRVGRPDRRSHRYDVGIDEQPAIVVFLKVTTERNALIMVIE